MSQIDLILRINLTLNFLGQNDSIFFFQCSKCLPLREQTSAGAANHTADSVDGEHPRNYVRFLRLGEVLLCPVVVGGVYELLQQLQAKVIVSGSSKGNIAPFQFVFLWSGFVFVKLYSVLFVLLFYYFFIVSLLSGFLITVISYIV